MSGYYNFLPPIDQVPFSAPPIYPPSKYLDAYLPEYNITTGDIMPLILNGSNVATNIYGVTGPVSPPGYGGFSGNPPAATPFAMFIYGQTSQGIMQFVLMRSSKLPNVSIFNTSYGYYFMPVSDTLDMSRVVSVYYTIDNSLKNINGAPNTATSQGIRFVDASLVQLNPSSNVYNYEMKYITFGSFSGNPDSAAAWPSQNQDLIGSAQNAGYLTFWFNEFVNASNSNETRLKIGELYHPYFVSLYSDTDGIYDEYAQYGLGFGYFSNPGPGYPVNINYGYAPINNKTLPVIPNGIDTTQVFNPGGSVSVNYSWPGQVPLTVYNSVIDNITNYNDRTLTSPFTPMPNLFDSNQGFLECSCNNNNECSESSNNYWSNNCNTIQAGIANYMIYQFIPFQHIKTPSNFVITDYRNTPYTYVTLPDGYTFSKTVSSLAGNIANQVGATGPTGPAGIKTYAMQVDQLIDGNTGATGYNVAQTSILSSWMINPNNQAYTCNRLETSQGFCGFVDYYDSLFGVDYNYGTCGDAGINGNPYQKGACPTGQMCVPNFKYLKGYDPVTNPPYICVSGATGISGTNFSNYETAGVPPKGAPSSVYPPYVPVTTGPNPPNKSGYVKPKEDKIWIYIGIAVLVILLIVIIVVLVKSRKKDLPITGSSIDVIPPLNPRGIRIVKY